MTVANRLASPPVVQLVGEVEHPDFRDAVDLLRASAQLVSSAEAWPELIIVAQSRPDVVSHKQVLQYQQEAPLAGVLALLGSWCEGETRTGRPWPGVERLYWYHFPTWWRRQNTLRAAGRCPDWARCGERGLPGTRRDGVDPRTEGVVVLNTAWRETAAALWDVLQGAGYATIWDPPGRAPAVVRGAAAGIWDGGQLSAREEDELAAFCRKLHRGGASVVALLDFPRRDAVDRAREIGATAVLGKPWLNTDLLATLEMCSQHRALLHAPPSFRAA